MELLGNSTELLRKFIQIRYLSECWVELFFLWGYFFSSSELKKRNEHQKLAVKVGGKVSDT